jgi:hypothetical protein
MPLTPGGGKLANICQAPILKAAGATGQLTKGGCRLMSAFSAVLEGGADGSRSGSCSALPHGHHSEIGDHPLMLEKPVFLTIINDLGLGSCSDRDAVDLAVTAGGVP